MARVELPSGILAIHGRLGNMVYRSRKQADGTYKVFVHEAKERNKRGVISRSRLEVGSKSARHRVGNEVVRTQPHTLMGKTTRASALPTETSFVGDPQNDDEK